LKPKTHTGTPAPTSVNREIRRSGVVNEDEVQMGESCVVLRDPGQVKCALTVVLQKTRITSGVGPTLISGASLGQSLGIIGGISVG